MLQDLAAYLTLEKAQVLGGAGGGGGLCAGWSAAAACAWVNRTRVNLAAG